MAIVEITMMMTNPGIPAGDTGGGGGVPPPTEHLSLDGDDVPQALDAGPGRQIAATYTSVSRRGGTFTVGPLPHRVLPGARPTVPASSTLPPWVILYLDLELSDPGAKKCFERILSMTLPNHYHSGEVIIRTMLEGLQAFFNYMDPASPYPQRRRLYPLQPCLLDAIGFDPSVPISKRAPV
ncbi:hypothetical protein PInf_016629 [Phytophthora infestans]|nr:hypothetical protein PInf_016629 [Phytophthora infestans]